MTRPLWHVPFDKSLTTRPFQIPLQHNHWFEIKWLAWSPSVRKYSNVYTRDLFRNESCQEEETCLDWKDNNTCRRPCYVNAVEVCANINLWLGGRNQSFNKLCQSLQDRWCSDNCWAWVLSSHNRGWPRNVMMDQKTYKMSLFCDAWWGNQYIV